MQVSAGWVLKHNNDALPRRAIVSSRHDGRKCLFVRNLHNNDVNEVISVNHRFYVTLSKGFLGVSEKVNNLTFQNIIE